MTEQKGKQPAPPVSAEELERNLATGGHYFQEALALRAHHRFARDNARPPTVTAQELALVRHRRGTNPLDLANANPEHIAWCLFTARHDLHNDALAVLKVIPNITVKEWQVLQAIYHNNYHDSGGPDTPIWSDCINDSARPSGIEGKALGGIVASLHRKGLVLIGGYVRDEQTIALTVEGQACVEARSPAGTYGASR